MLYSNIHCFHQIKYIGINNSLNCQNSMLIPSKYNFKKSHLLKLFVKYSKACEDLNYLCPVGTILYLGWVFKHAY